MHVRPRRCDWAQELQPGWRASRRASWYRYYCVAACEESQALPEAGLTLCLGAAWLWPFAHAEAFVVLWKASSYALSAQQCKRSQACTYMAMQSTVQEHVAWRQPASGCPSWQDLR